jgi:hypothetical protein
MRPISRNGADLVKNIGERSSELVGESNLALSRHRLLVDRHLLKIIQFKKHFFINICFLILGEKILPGKGGWWVGGRVG